MPSRPLPVDLPAAITTPEIPQHHPIHHRHSHRVLVPVLAGTLAFAVVGVVFAGVFFIYRKLSRNRTAPFENNHGSSNQSQAGASGNCQHRRFSYSLLRRATASFSAANLLGHGGFGSVYKATLPSGESLAVKVMDSEGSIQGEREFQNELALALNLSSPYILSLLGFSTDHRGRKMLLVYELMPNRSLQEALFDRKCSELMDWKRRFRIALDIALGLEYLHHGCAPAVIHGDVKPSNVLLASDFAAKIGDFGLARLKTEDCDQNHRAVVVEEEGEDEDSAAEKGRGRSNKELFDNGSIVEEETESVSVITGGFDEGTGNSAVDRSPRVSETNPEASPEELLGSGNGRRKGGSNSARDWWWKQENCGESESGRVKDYVMEWIGNEISKERPKKTEWSESEIDPDAEAKKKKKKRRKRLEWWASMEERKESRKKKKKPREWWKEEFCEELTRKSKNNKKKKCKKSLSFGGDSWWQRDGDDDDGGERKKKRKSSRGSIDWWLEGVSGEIIRSGRRNSQDWASGDIPKSGNISSTPSMRGTVCYVAPEYGGGGLLSEKCDVYSYGVLILVLVSGRRPLQVTASPMSEFERANLTSWARQLARNGRLIELVDPALHSVDKEEALLCLTIALLCLQRTPGKRPSMREIVGMLSGEAEPPHLPFEFSPSPPSNFPFKSRKKAR